MSLTYNNYFNLLIDMQLGDKAQLLYLLSFVNGAFVNSIGSILPSTAQRSSLWRQLLFALI
ncbi:MAG TPA: hypothetical protein VK658_14615 [Chryseolinea sp.]|nr:hypothetical protein [Chryseolinea sp.]